VTTRSILRNRGFRKQSFDPLASQSPYARKVTPAAKSVATKQPPACTSAQPVRLREPEESGSAVSYLSDSDRAVVNDIIRFEQAEQAERAAAKAAQKTPGQEFAIAVEKAVAHVQGRAPRNLYDEPVQSEPAVAKASQKLPGQDFAIAVEKAVAAAHGRAPRKLYPD